MTSSSQHYLVVITLGADRPEVVNIVTRHVSSCGCNIEDSRLAMLGGKFAFIMLPSDSRNAITLIEPVLPLRGTELDPLIVIKCTTACPRPPIPVSVWVQVDVVDFPHLIGRFTALFDAHYTNTAELVSRTQPAENERAAQLRVQIATHSSASAGAVNIGQAFKALYTEFNA